LNRQVKELRTEAQLDRRFSRRELFTIFANRAWFGDGQVGVEAASEHFFKKEPNQLQVAEAALLAGLIRAPSHCSPLVHPDRALKRRNEVIDAMVATHAFSATEGEAAKATGIGVATR
jgi:membrane peptidoglycan carboxypeptidase